MLMLTIHYNLEIKTELLEVSDLNQKNINGFRALDLLVTKWELTSTVFELIVTESLKQNIKFN